MGISFPEFPAASKRLLLVDLRPVPPCGKDLGGLPMRRYGRNRTPKLSDEEMCCRITASVSFQEQGFRLFCTAEMTTPPLPTLSRIRLPSSHPPRNELPRKQPAGNFAAKETASRELSCQRKQLAGNLSARNIA